jgi:hypothetical protein
MGEGTQAQAHALASSYKHHVDRVIDSGASKHMTGMSSPFKIYSPYTSHSESVQIADGTSRQIHGIGSIECTPSLSITSVLHVPPFLVNLIQLAQSLINSSAQ